MKRTNTLRSMPVLRLIYWIDFGTRGERMAEERRTARTAQAGRRTESRSRYGDRPYRRVESRNSEKQPAAKERRRLRQMAVSAVLLLLVVTVKLTLPDVMERYRQQVLSLLGEDTDFVETFSAVGRVVAPDSAVGEALNDAYTAVFGAEETADRSKESAPPTASRLPAQVRMTQQVLGFPYTAPLAGEITGKFGYRTHPILGEELFHYGLDIAAESGTEIHAFADGEVTVVGESSELGKYVVLAHGTEYTTLYAHCSEITAASGKQVTMGETVAKVGSTGQSTGPHLHFELQRGNTFLNPIYYAAP